MATAAERHPAFAAEATQTRLSRRAWDQIISGTGAVVAMVMAALGAAAIYGGSFALDNVKDRLEPQKISFPPPRP